MTIKGRARILSLAVASAFLLQAGASARTQATADSIIDQYFAAIGGRDALSKITTQRITGTMTIGTPNGDLKGPMELLQKAPTKARLYLTLDLSPMGVSDKLVLEQKFDGNVGWMLDSMQGNREITGNQLENMKNNYFPSPLLNYKTSGATVATAPNETINGKSAQVIVYTPKAGSPARIYFDPETHLILRTKMTVSTPDTGDLEQTRDVSDYRVVGGIKWPFKQVSVNSMQSITMDIEKIELNVPIDDAVFVAKAPVVR